MIKDTGEQPDEEIHGARSGRVPNTGTSVSIDLEYMPASWHVSVFANPEVL